MPIVHDIQKKFIGCLLLALFGLVFVASFANAEEKNMATVLYFEQSEPDIEPYQVRYIITNQFLRIDEGRASDGYILFDDKKNTIFSVSHNNKSVLKVAPDDHAVPDSVLTLEKNLKLEEKERSDIKLPMIGVHQVIAYELSGGQSICTEYSVAEKLLPEVIPMLLRYEKVISKNSRRNLINQPKEYLTDCMLINDIFAAGKYLQRGFPVMLAKKDGLRRLLINYNAKQEIEGSLFSLPAGYRVFEAGS